MLKPIALKNESIAIIRAFSQRAVIGTVLKGTRKGDVAHLAPDITSVDGRARDACPSLVLFPRFISGSSFEAYEVAPEIAFAKLAFNSFNYANLGEIAFHAVADLVEKTKAFQIHYGRLEDVVAWIDEMFDSLPAEA
jgi:hypothetical protein